MGMHKIQICTSSCSESVSGGCGNLKNTLDVTNNKSRYYAELAKKYMELAKSAKEEAQYYAEQNSDVTKVYVNGIKNELLDKINLRQPAGNYALRTELPVNVSELQNDSGYLTLNTALQNLAGNDLSNLSALGQAVLDNKSDVSLQNLTALGNARLQYAPFAINNGTVVNGNNHTLLSGSFSQAWSESGTYSVEISEAGNYEIEMYGAGGGMAGNAASASWYCGGGGSGAGFKGVVTLPVGNYSVTIGSGGARNAAYNTATRHGGDGEATTFSNLVTCGGGIGGYVSGGTRRGGAGGELSLDGSLTVVSQTLASDGNTGDAAASSNVSGGLSLQDGTHTGAGAGGGYSNDAIDGFFKITKATGDASKIFCDPCTITTADGRTKTFYDSVALDIQTQADGTYSIFKDYETGELSVSDSFDISKNDTGSQYWLDNSNIPANLKVNGLINNDLVCIGSCTLSNGAVTALINRYFNACPYQKDLVDSYVNGQSGYNIYSNGWCEQWGFCAAQAKGDITVTLLKSYKNTDYLITGSILSSLYVVYERANQISIAAGNITESSFTMRIEDTNSIAGKYWKTEGYIA